MGHTKHLYRAFILIVLALLGAMVVRGFLIPNSFGINGHYREDNITEQMDQQMKFGDSEDCVKCHEEQFKELKSDKHENLSCEGCHDTLLSHVKKDEKVSDMLIDKSKKLCLKCHEFLISRPKTFPQIELKKHLSDQGAEDAKAVCFDCHSPHLPLKNLK